MDVKEFPRLSLSGMGFFGLVGLGGGGGVLPLPNIRKCIRCMPMKISNVNCMVKLNIRYTFVVMARNCDVICRQKFGFDVV